MRLYTVARSMVSVISKLIFKVEVRGKENIQNHGKLIICSNHINILDPIILSIKFPKQIHWMGKKQIFEKRILGCFLKKIGAFPVNREESDLSAIKTSLRILKSNGVLGIFPEGTRVKEVNYKNSKPGVALIAIKAKSPILPVYIEGNFKLFSKITVTFGEVIDFSQYYDKKLTTEEYKFLSQNILKIIYELKNRKDEI